jgi:hypothetical protein
MRPARRIATLACALALAGVGSYFLVTSTMTVAQHGRLHGRLGIVAVVMVLLGAYWLWAHVIKATPSKEG